MHELITINNVRGYLDESGTAHLNLEDISRGLGFVQTKNSAEYIRWERVNGYLENMGFPQLVGKAYIPENVFYRLAMKGENESAVKFQITIADEVLPSIRRHGAYMTPAKIEEVLLNPDTIIRLATALKAEQEKSRALAEAKEELEIALDMSLKYTSVRRYNAEHRMGWNLEACKGIGKRLSAYCRSQGIQPKRIKDELFGEVNGYPQDVWERFLCQNRAKGEAAAW